MTNYIEAQKAFFITQATKDVSFRIKQLKKLAKLLDDNEAALHKAIHDDFKKSAFENYVTELAFVQHDIKEAIRNIDQWTRVQDVQTNIANFPAKSYIIPEPLGTCLVIGAWNYPYQLSLAPAVAAIAAGNTVIIKPSEMPSNTARVMATLINKAFDPRVLKVIEGGVAETTALLNQDFDKIFFTGSTTVGKIVYKAAAEKLIPVTLELGGKSPAIITKDANLKMAAKRLIWAKFLNAGQTCIAPDYILIHKSKQETFLKYAVAEIEKAKYAFENGNYVQIINDKNFDRLFKMLDASKTYIGGQNNKKDRYIAPTVLTNISWDHPTMKEEIFGPILPVISYYEIDEVFTNVRKFPKPLSLYVFTSNSKTKSRVLNELSFGGGAVNEAVMHISNPHLPFGGVGTSGIGTYHGKAGFDCFTHYKSILDKPTWLELPIKFSPYSKTKLAWLRRLFKLQ
ncbi:aldehyde dehydrogenase [unidentified eubacterium SCB49]|nr:aldehyde dehydrogenase [unidentified eubacterium SCB49]